MRLKIVILLLIAISSFNIAAQTEEDNNKNKNRPKQIERKSSFGFWAHFNLNQHRGDFSTLPGVPGCCRQFNNGDGMGFSAGLLYEIPMNPFLFLDLRAGYYLRSGAFTETEYQPISINGNLGTAEIEHKLNATLGSIGFEPTLGIRIVDGLSLNLGLNAGFYLPKYFKKTEELISPDQGYFTMDYQKDWLYRDGDIPDASYNLDFVARMSYEFPINSKRTVWLAPEFAINYGLTPVINNSDWDGSWNMNIIRFGLAIKFSPSYGIQLDLGPETQAISVNKYELCDSKTQYFCLPDSAAFDVDLSTEVGVKNYNYAIKHKDYVLDFNDINSDYVPDKVIWKIPMTLPEKLYSVSDSLTYVFQAEDKVGQKVMDSVYIVINSEDYRLSSEIEMKKQADMQKVESVNIEDLVSGSRNISMTATPDMVYMEPNTSSMGEIKKWKSRIRANTVKLYDTTGFGNPPERINLSMNELLKNLPPNYSGNIYYSLEAIDQFGNICTDEKRITLDRKEFSVKSNFRTFGRSLIDSVYYVKENPTIKIEERISTRLQPLLNYVFFEDNSAVIPERYVRLNDQETKAFKIDDMHDSHTLETYHNVLNIIGKRMLENPDAVITIQGCNSNLGEEKRNLTLSENRAKSVYNYLKDTWNIPDSRMVLAEPRNKPEQASSTSKPNTQDYEDGLAENRRVEITSDDYNIVKPILTYGKRYTVQPKEIFFLPEIDSELGLEDWKFEAIARDKEFKQFSGSNTMDDTLHWNIQKQKIALADSRASFINTYLKANTDKGLSSVSENVIPMEVISKSEGEGKDTTYDEYSLILFDFGSGSIGDNNQKIIDVIKERVNPGAIVSIVGHTDRVGKEKANIRLSTKRAKSTDKSLDFDKSVYSVSSRGAGEDELLYPNDLPEARFYCRTVKIEVANPVIK